MVIRINTRDLDCDDDGHWKGLRKKKYIAPSSYWTIQRLLQAWLPVKEEGGYASFIEEHSLQDVVTESQLETLFTNPKARMGKRLAGILSLLVPAEHCSWMQMKNIYERVGGQQGRVEVEIPKKAAHDYVSKLARTEGLEFKHLLKLHRRFQLRTQKNVAVKSGISSSIITDYEKGESYPEPAIAYNICNALGLDEENRLLMLDAAGKGAVAQMEDKKHWRKGLESIMGGGSVFGALLYNLRIDKEWSQRDLEKKSGVCEGNIAGYEKGKHWPTRPMLHKLCDALGVNKKTRLLLLEAADKGAIARIEDKNNWRKWLMSATEGGSLFSALLYNLRIANEWTKVDLAKKSGVSMAAIDNYERGKSCPTPDIVHRLCDTLDVDNEIRLVMLDAAGKGAIDQLQDENHWREGLASIAGGGSIFGALLFNLRIQKGYSHADLLKKANISSPALRAYETGKNYPQTLTIVHRLCDALEVGDRTRDLLLNMIALHKGRTL